MSGNDNPPNGHGSASVLGVPGVGVGVQQQSNHGMFQHVNGHMNVGGTSHGHAQAVQAVQQQQQVMQNPNAVAAQQAALAAAHQILQAQMQQASAAANANSPGGTNTSSAPGTLQLSQFQQAANALQMVGSAPGPMGSAPQQLLQNSTDVNAAATLAGFHPSTHSQAPSASGSSTPVLQVGGAPVAAAPVAFNQMPNATAPTLQALNHLGMGGSGAAFPGMIQNPAQAAALLAAALGINMSSANPTNYAAQAFALMLQQQQQKSDQQSPFQPQPQIQVPQPVQQHPGAVQVQAHPQQQPHSPQGQQQQRVTPTPPLHQQNQMDPAATQHQAHISQQQQQQVAASLSQNFSSVRPSPVSSDQQQQSASQNSTTSSKVSPTPPKKRASKPKKLPKSMAEAGRQTPSLKTSSNQQQALNHINHSSDGGGISSPSPVATSITAQAPTSALSFNPPTQQLNHVSGAFQIPTPVAAAITQASAAQALHNSIATMTAQAQAKPVGVNVPGHSHVNHNTPNTIAMAEPNHSNLYSASLNPLVLSQMQTWKLDQLEGHVQLLRDTNQPVPNAVQVLLAEARKMEEKRAAKRIANRRSACTSRARKKALVAEMTRTNARLRRQAVILSLLPDLVIAIKVDGEITFCSAQVERVLRHKVGEMVGENICEVLTQPSRSALSGLISKLVAAEKAVLEDSNKEGDESGRSSNSGNTSGAAIVSEQSDQRFPPSVVNVQKNQNSGRPSNAADSSGNGNNGGTRVGGSGTTISRSGTQSPLSNSDGATNPVSNKGGKGSGNSGDESSSSSDAKNLSKANEALNRNVRFHNEQLKIKKDAKKNGIAHKDDVTGDFVTANNADARLSSLRLQVMSEEEAAKKGSASNDEMMEDNASFESNDSLLAGVEDKRHQKRKRAENNASDDSGYRESAESDPSREDSTSSTSDTSNGGRPRPLAPTCNICLIRADLTTIWCEVTSSIRTRSLDEDDPEVVNATTGESLKEKRPKNSQSNNISDGQQPDQESVKIKELLLCLRPIRDGEERVSEDLRFTPKSQKSVPMMHISGEPKRVENNGEVALPSPSTGDATKHNSLKYQDKKNEASLNVSKHSTCSRPMKKRQMSLNGSDAGNNGHISKKQVVERQGDNETEKSAVESLILMSGHQK